MTTTSSSHSKRLESRRSVGRPRKRPVGCSERRERRANKDVRIARESSPGFRRCSPKRPTNFSGPPSPSRSSTRTTTSPNTPSSIVHQSSRPSSPLRRPLVRPLPPRLRHISRKLARASFRQRLPLRLRRLRVLPLSPKSPSLWDPRLISRPASLCGKGRAECCSCVLSGATRIPPPANKPRSWFLSTRTFGSAEGRGNSWASGPRAVGPPGRCAAAGPPGRCAAHHPLTNGLFQGGLSSRRLDAEAMMSSVPTFFGSKRALSSSLVISLRPASLASS